MRCSKCSDDSPGRSGRESMPQGRHTGRSAGGSFLRSAAVVAVAFMLTRGLAQLIRDAPVTHRGPNPAEPVGTGNEPPVGGAIFD